MDRKIHLPIEIKLNAPNADDYWKRIDWCWDNIGKQMGSDDLLPPGKWFHFYDGVGNDSSHIFCFADEELATKFAMVFSMGFFKE